MPTYYMQPRDIHTLRLETRSSTVSTYWCSHEVYTLSKTHYQYIIYTSIMSRDKLSANLLHRATSHTHYVSRHVLTYGMQIYTCYYANLLHADFRMSTSAATLQAELTAGGSKFHPELLYNLPIPALYSCKALFHSLVQFYHTILWYSYYSR